MTRQELMRLLISEEKLWIKDLCNGGPPMRIVRVDPYDDGILIEYKPNRVFVPTSYHREISFPMNFIWQCSRTGCDSKLTGTLRQLEQEGWIDISTHGNANQWLCPIHARGFRKATP
jgi:hypothetical protein